MPLVFIIQASCIASEVHKQFSIISQDTFHCFQSKITNTYNIFLVYILFYNSVLNTSSISLHHTFHPLPAMVFHGSYIFTVCTKNLFHLYTTFSFKEFKQIYIVRVKRGGKNKQPCVVG